MEGSTKESTLHTFKEVPFTSFNRIFAIAYTFAIFALLYHHILLLFHSTTLLSFSIFVADLCLAFMWATTQSFRMRPILRQTFPENLERVLARKDFLAMDIFVCTADPYKEPPINVVNTALSLMAYDYPPEMISVYVSDDGGSELTLFAFMEAAKFARHWLPFCRENNIVDRCPDVFFRSNYATSSESEKIKVMYESMKVKVENVVERGKVNPEYITNEHELPAFQQWTKGFTRHEHPPVVQVLLESGNDKDMGGHPMPNLVYVSREKSRTTPHHFKAGALNALIRVSGIMTNAPIVLTQDCDMYSSDPQTPHRMLCYFSDPSVRSKVGYIQFPQRYHGINKADIYASEIKRLFVINPVGMGGLAGPNHYGTGCFFLRRAFFGGPSSKKLPEIPELDPDHAVEKAIQSKPILALACNVAGCNYENETVWGSEMGFRYGSLVEDYYTGYRLQCEGWKSIFCHPSRPAFLGDVPITLIDALSQNKRWCVGLLEVAFSKYNPLSFGSRSMGPLMGLCYAHYAFWPIVSIPVTIYAFLPQIALLNGVYIFPKVTDPWFFLYIFLFLGSYGQDCFDFIYFQGTIHQWWNEQRMWLIRGITSYLFGLSEYIIKSMGLPTPGFNVTSKVLDDEQSKRYDQGIIEFGIASPMFLPLTMAAVFNVIAFIAGLAKAFQGGDLEVMFAQMFIAGFVILNSWPIYEAMILRKDRGRMATKTTVTSTFLALALSSVVYFIH